MKHSYEREMSISHQEFFRLLPIALKNMDYEIIDDNQVRVFYAGGKIEILPGLEQKRKIASLELPVLHVIFTFTGVSSENIALFTAEFSRVYQRGGG